MSSQFGWVDFAETDRQRMLNVVQLFREQETRDELGIGTIRDAFADYFFPGTSTIQTRIRYMLFIPWIYRNLERKGISSDQIAQRARQDEIKLIYALLDSDDTDGVIGRQAKSNLQRLPSSIYWSGLGSWGIRLFHGSQDQYHRYLDFFYQRRRQRQAVRSEVDRELAIEAIAENWDPGLLDPPAKFPETAELALTQPEARYLRERICLSHRESLLAYLVSETDWFDAKFLWEHPVVHQVPAKLKAVIDHAQNFSETIYGAALLYNLMLARKRKQSDLADHYQARFISWVELLAERWSALTTWHQNLSAFWLSPAFNLARIPYPTRDFVEAWLKLVFSYGHQLAQLTDDKTVHQLIQEREVRLKRGRARLENDRALERWVGQSGDQRLDYRWYITQSFAADILDGSQS